MVARVLKLFLILLPVLLSQLSHAEVQTLNKPRALKVFSLRDQHGQPIGPSQFEGRWSMVFAGFTACPDICPLTLGNLEAVRADLSLRLRPESLPTIVFVAVDPVRDEPVLKDYLAYFHPSYVGLTGEEEQLDRLMKGLGGQYRIKRKFRDDPNYEVLHSAQVFVVNPQAQVVATISPPFKPHPTAEYLANLIRGRPGE